jgi:hypothetical protein
MADSTEIHFGENASRHLDCLVSSIQTLTEALDKNTQAQEIPDKKEEFVPWSCLGRIINRINIAIENLSKEEKVFDGLVAARKIIREEMEADVKRCKLLYSEGA